MYPVLNYASNMDRDRLKFWQKPGDELDPDMNPAFQYRNGKTCSGLWQYADKHIERGDYIKLRDITLGYTFPRQWLRSAYIQGLRLSLQIQNAFYWAAIRRTSIRKWLLLHPEDSIFRLLTHLVWHSIFNV